MLPAQNSIIYSVDLCHIKELTSLIQPNHADHLVSFFPQMIPCTLYLSQGELDEFRDLYMCQMVEQYGEKYFVNSDMNINLPSGQNALIEFNDKGIFVKSISWIPRDTQYGNTQFAKTISSLKPDQVILVPNINSTFNQNRQYLEILSKNPHVTSLIYS